MTSSKIKNILGTPDNKWVFFKNVTVIKMKQKVNIYLSGDEIFYLDSSNELLYVSENKEYKNKESLSTNKNEYPHKYKIDINYIGGFLCTSHLDNGVLK